MEKQECFNYFVNEYNIFFLKLKRIKKYSKVYWLKKKNQTEQVKASCLSLYLTSLVWVQVVQWLLVHIKKEIGITEFKFWLMFFTFTLHYCPRIKTGISSSSPLL